MTGRSLEKLRAARDQTRVMIRVLDGGPFQHPRISLPLEEAQKAAVNLERWLDDMLCIVEAELYHGPLTKE